jgi:DNA recombination protein RmuC
VRSESVSFVVPVLVGVVCTVLGAALGGALARSRAAARQSALREELAELRGRSGSSGDLLELFRSASTTAMREQSEQFLRLAETRYQVLERSAEAQWSVQGESLLRHLDEYSGRLRQLEEQRQRESTVLGEAVSGLCRSTEQVRDEARGLAAALTNSGVRGSWGEMQLRRVLEQSGMVSHADFVEQASVAAPDQRGRPDVVVRLPNGRSVVIDSKAPLDGYLRASSSQDPAERRAHHHEHARAVVRHVESLSKRRYEDLVEGAVDFVVMFVPGDAFLAAAFEVRPELLEEAAARNVILASPSTLMAFLRGVASGWRERQVAEEAEVIARLGRDLHERIAIFGEHFVGVGRALDRAVRAYNDSVGSMERRLLATARKFSDHGAGSTRSLPVAEPITEVPAIPGAPELSGVNEPDEAAAGVG